MKYLKYFEEVGEKLDIDHYNGLTKEHLEDMFVEVSDMGFDVIVSLTQRTVVVNSFSENEPMKLGDIPYVEVRISSPLPSGEFHPEYRADWEQHKLEGNRRLLDLYNNSDELKEIIDVVDERIGEYKWYVSEVMLDGHNKLDSHTRRTIKVFLHRDGDEKYVVPYISAWNKNK